MDDAPVTLSASGTTIVLSSQTGIPQALHWGADLDLPSADLLPAAGGAWFGRPWLSGHRDGVWRPLRLVPESRRLLPAPAGGRFEARALDADWGLRLDTEIELTPHGVVRMRHSVVNTADEPFTVERLAAALPLPAHAAEILDFGGRWARERSPQRAPLRQGVWSRENRRGRTGFDAGPMVVGEGAFGFRHGEVWAVHAAWSGNHEHFVERLADGTTVLAAGELLGSGEIRLARGQEYQTPWVYFAHSTEGLDGLSRSLHAMVRDRPSHPRTPRPLTLNTWEAVYFDHREDKLTALAEHAARVGVERFVVDDGWFLGRRDDTAGLGDWYVDQAVWPDGALHRLAAEVKRLGMQFGLWFEPEMANPDSRLLREHPDWLLADPERLPREHRHQHTLDVARPEVYAYLLGCISALIGEYGIDYLKWDHNRDLADPVHAGSTGTHEQTLAAYRLMAELRERHPGLEIESCSSGGARADLGVLEHTDRIWGSDTMDPFDRQQIQRWTGLLLPPELVGSHVGADRAHITERTTSLSFRCATALFGHAGIEADLTAWDERDVEQLTQWAASYKRLRGLLHSGETVRLEHPEGAAWVHGIVAADRSRAVFAYVQLDTSSSESCAPMRLAGLDPARVYTVTVEAAASCPRHHWPAWAVESEGRGIEVAGSFLQARGLPSPSLASRPGNAFVVTLESASTMTGVEL